jgi:uncharacterized protein (UPF0332 family)
MKGDKKELVKYRYEKALETFDDAKILAENKRWNSTINRLYYAAYYAVSALLIHNDMNPGTHTGVKLKFSESFIKEKIIGKEYGKIFSQLFTWRQKGDYDDLFDFSEEIVLPYFNPVFELIQLIGEEINK